MQEFKGKTATDYDKNIKKVLPGYDLLHQLTAAYLAENLKNNAEILLVGAGTCRELEALGNLNLGWKFCAQDISADMLEIGKTKLSPNILKRTEFFCTPIENLPAKKFDAVLSLFVLHFVENPTQKQFFLNEIAKRTKDEGFLILADLFQTQIENSYKFLAKQYEIIGMSQLGIERSVKNLKTNFYPISQKKLDELLENATFKTKQKFFQALEFAAFVINK